MAPGLVILLCLLAYAASLKTALAFLLAAVFHELGHILAIRICGGRLQALAVGSCGAILSVADLSPAQELFCALLGPLFSFLLLPFGKFFPRLALFGLAQGIYNLLPVYPMDGGRALHCLLMLFLTQETAWHIVRTVGILLSLISSGLCVWATVVCHYGVAPSLFAGIFLYRAALLWQKL